MKMNLIAKPVNNKFWIVTDGNEKVGNVEYTGSGFDVRVNGSISHFDSTTSIQKQTKITFLHGDMKVKTAPIISMPTTKHVHNSIMDVKLKLHLFTKNRKSKCYHAAGWFVMRHENKATPIFCPKYLFIKRYNYSGPYTSKEEALAAI
jgi:hypothetical protein